MFIINHLHKNDVCFYLAIETGLHLLTSELKKILVWALQTVWLILEKFMRDNF